MKRQANHSLFILRKITTSKWTRVRLALSWEHVFPAAEKICSPGVDVVGMHKRDPHFPFTLAASMLLLIQVTDAHVLSVHQGVGKNLMYHSELVQLATVKLCLAWHFTPWDTHVITSLTTSRLLNCSLTNLVVDYFSTNRLVVAPLIITILIM